MKRLAIVLAVGWAALVELAYVLADRRIAICTPFGDAHLQDITCTLRATAARDATLIWGIGLALVAIAVLLVISQLRQAPATRQANPAGHATQPARVSRLP